MAVDGYGYDLGKILRDMRYELKPLQRGRRATSIRNGDRVELYGGSADGAMVTWGPDGYVVPFITMLPFETRQVNDHVYAKGHHPNGYWTYLHQGVMDERSH